MSGGVELGRVVAVVAVFSDGSYQVGSGYLITGRLVLTAEHCTRDKTRPGRAPRELRVIRASDHVQASGVEVVASSPAAGEGEGLDLAVLHLHDAPWQQHLPAPVYVRVDRSVAGILQDCQAIGYPLFQYRPDTKERGSAELHGTIYQTELAASGRLVLREPLLSTVTPPPQDDADGGGTASAWGGLSGAVVFHRGRALGVIVEHHPQQGTAAVQLAAFDQLLQDAANAGSGAAAVALMLSLTPGAPLPVAAAQLVSPLADLVDLLIDRDLPRVDALDPYRLGVTPSDHGDRATYGINDPYVRRTYNDVDDRLRGALTPGQFALLTGPSKAGKSRTAFEVLRQSWPTAYLIAPQPTVPWDELTEHPRLRTPGDAVVVWMDDIDRFLKGNNQLTPGRVTALVSRPGDTVLLGTLRTDRMAELRDDTGELSRDTRLLLESAITIELASTQHSPEEQAAARTAYPDQVLDESGLGEQLAHAPQLLTRYRESQEAPDPLRFLIVRCAVDWARAGITRPIPEPDLKALTKAVAWQERPDLEVTAARMNKVLVWARTSLPGRAKAALLVTHPLPDKIRGYRPFDYLVAADEGQHGDPRPIREDFWDLVLERSRPEEAARIATAAYYRNAVTPAIAAYQKAANAGDTGAMFNLAVLLSDRLNPPELNAARAWYERAANAGDTGAMINLGLLLTFDIDPPDLDLGRVWLERAADTGNTGAMSTLALIATQLDPPDLNAARAWYERAANAGDIEAMNDLGYLLTSRIDPPDLNAARAWYERAAKAGDPRYDAEYLLPDGLDPDEMDPDEMDPWT